MSEDHRNTRRASWNSNLISALAGMIVASLIALVAVGAGKIDRSQAKDMMDLAMAPVFSFQSEIREHWVRDSIWKENWKEKLMQQKNKAMN